MISLIIAFLNNIIWKNYMNTRFFYKKKKDKLFIVKCKKTNEGGLLL